MCHLMCEDIHRDSKNSVRSSILVIKRFWIQNFAQIYHILWADPVFVPLSVVFQVFHNQSPHSDESVRVDQVLICVTVELADHGLSLLINSHRRIQDYLADSDVFDGLPFCGPSNAQQVDLVKGDAAKHLQPISMGMHWALQPHWRQ